MPDIFKTFVFEFEAKHWSALPLGVTGVTAAFYVPHEVHQKAKKEGKAFSVFRARLRVRQTWMNKGANPVALGNQFHIDYLDRKGEWKYLGDSNFHPFNEATHDQEYDISEHFGQGNFGVNLMRFAYVRYDHPGQINKYKLELSVTITYGSGG